MIVPLKQNIRNEIIEKRVARGLCPPARTRFVEFALASITHGTLALANETTYQIQRVRREGRAVATGPVFQ